MEKDVEASIILICGGGDDGIMLSSSCNGQQGVPAANIHGFEEKKGEYHVEETIWN